MQTKVSVQVTDQGKDWHLFHSVGHLTLSLSSCEEVGVTSSSRSLCKLPLLLRKRQSTPMLHRIIILTGLRCPPGQRSPAALPLKSTGCLLPVTDRVRKPLNEKFGQME